MRERAVDGRSKGRSEEGQADCGQRVSDRIWQSREGVGWVGVL